MIKFPSGFYEKPKIKILKNTKFIFHQQKVNIKSTIIFRTITTSTAITIITVLNYLSFPLCCVYGVGGCLYLFCHNKNYSKWLWLKVLYYSCTVVQCFLCMWILHQPIKIYTWVTASTLHWKFKTNYVYCLFFIISIKIKFFKNFPYWTPNCPSLLLAYMGL